VFAAPAHRDQGHLGAHQLTQRPADAGWPTVARFLGVHSLATT
jgi:hypothetical protein